MLVVLIEIILLFDGVSGANNWWYLGLVGSQYLDSNQNNFAGEQFSHQLTNNRILPKSLSPGGNGRSAGERNGLGASNCRDLHFLTNHQQEICRSSSGLIRVVAEGAELGIRECKHQFQTNHWNCSTSVNMTNVFGTVIHLESKETAFIYAITSAGIMYSTTKACAVGRLTSCSCDTRVSQRDTHGAFQWGGCSHNVRFGRSLSRQFVDKLEKRSSEIGLMNLWNNEAGRKAISLRMRLMCKCHGVSGSCSTKICWRVMPVFRAVGSQLKRKFEGATMVRLNKRETGLRRINIKQKKPTKRDLIYLKESPDFCHYDPRYGSLGTSTRQCNPDPYAADSCTILCCGRGARPKRRRIESKCRCKFKWCCRVECETCVERATEYFCK